MSKYHPEIDHIVDSLKVGDRVRHDQIDIEGTIVDLTTLGEVVEDDCPDEDKDSPWYKIAWDHGQFIGQEFEGQLTKI